MSATDVVRYLLDRKLLTPRAVVHGRLRIDDVSRSNRVFVVTADGERCYVVKFAEASGDPGVAREAAVLERLRSLDAGGPLASFLPTPVEYDEAVGVLIVESAPHSRDLTRQHARGRFSRLLARQVGIALALLHSVPPTALQGLGLMRRPVDRAVIHRPDLEAMRGLSGAAVELTRMVQRSDELCAALDELDRAPRVKSVIHGDVRWDNFLALRGAGSNRWVGLRLIDWELCGVGDPGFDIGAFFGEYLRVWLQSIPIAEPGNPALLLAHARLPLRRMRPALTSFWDAYVRQRGLSLAESNATLRRSTRFAAVHLLTAALEEAQTLSDLSASVFHLLPLSQNILTRPREAAELFGLGSSWAAG